MLHPARQPSRLSLIAAVRGNRKGHFNFLPARRFCASVRDPPSATHRICRAIPLRISTSRAVNPLRPKISRIANMIWSGLSSGIKPIETSASSIRTSIGSLIAAGARSGARADGDSSDAILRQIERRIFGCGRDGDQAITELELVVGQPVVFAAEDDRDFIGAGNSVEFRRRGAQRMGAAAIAAAAAGGADRDRAIRQRGRQIGIDRRTGQNVIGMHRHRGRLAIVQGAGRDQAKIVEAHVLERSRRGTDIARRLRPEQDEGEFLPRSHRLI